MNTALVQNFTSPILQVTDTPNASEADKSLKICITVILIIIIILTILGNGLVCWVFYRQPHLKGVSYYPILSLAFADILCGVCAMPAYIAKKHVSGGEQERITCDTFRFTYFFSVYASVLSLTAISVERFVAIKMPVRHRTLLTKQKMLAGLLLSWFDAALVSVLPFFWQREDTDEALHVQTFEGMEHHGHITECVFAVCCYVCLPQLHCQLRDTVFAREIRSKKYGRCRCKTQYEWAANSTRGPGYCFDEARARYYLYYGNGFGRFYFLLGSFQLLLLHSYGVSALLPTIV